MDLHKIPAGPELDVLIAEKIMGWTDWRDGDRVKPPGEDSRQFRPSTDIAAAFEVAKKMHLFKNCRHLHEHRDRVGKAFDGDLSDWEWVVEQVFEPLDHNVILGRGETAALAICRAALEVVWELEAANEQ